MSTFAILFLSACAIYGLLLAVVSIWRREIERWLGEDE